MLNKNVSIIILLVALISIMLSCATNPVRTNYTYVPMINSKYGRDVAKIKAQPIFGGRNTDWGLEGISLQITNIKDTPLKVFWEYSSITYQNTEYPIVVLGQDISDSDLDYEITEIPPGQSIETTIFSSDQIQYEEGSYAYMKWENKLISNEPRIGLYVVSDGRREYYTIRFRQTKLRFDGTIEDVPAIQIEEVLMEPQPVQ
jgi:hypothetical protein